LREVTDEFLKAENSFRPDYLENIFAPAGARRLILPLVTAEVGT
jgi:hypothetical protein